MEPKLGLEIHRNPPRHSAGRRGTEQTAGASVHPWTLAYGVLGAISGIAATAAEGILLQTGGAILTWTLFSLGASYGMASWREIRDRAG